MKKLLTLIMLAIFSLTLISSSSLFSQGRGNGNTKVKDILEPISVSGTVILDTSKSINRYYLDTNSDGTKEYELAFGPKWYTPTTGAVRPLNGETVSITGDVFSKSKIPLIVVYTINGLQWRDSLSSRSLRNKFDPDSLKKHFSPWANRFGWCVKDSLITVTLTGKAIVDSVSTHHKVFYLDELSDGTKDYLLMFGPWWYTPTSGAVRPLNGDLITIKGGMFQKDSSLIKMVVIQEINGLSWLDSLGKYPWPGKKVKRGSTSSSVIRSLYDPKSTCEFSNNSFGNMFGNLFSSEIYSSINEIDPVDLPVTASDKIVAAFSVNVTDNSMSSIFMPFDKNISFTLSYNNAELGVGNFANKNLSVKYLSDDNELYNVSNAKFDYTNKTVTFAQTLINGTYVIEASEIAKATAVEENVIPEKISLYQNYPNPFNPETRISFDIPQKGNVKLTIYNIIGSEVRSLVNNDLEQGTYHVTWNGKDNFGRSVASGIYLYKLESNNNSVTKKMNLIK